MGFLVCRFFGGRGHECTNDKSQQSAVPGASYEHADGGTCQSGTDGCSGFRPPDAKSKRITGKPSTDRSSCDARTLKESNLIADCNQQFQPFVDSIRHPIHISIGSTDNERSDLVADDNEQFQSISGSFRWPVVLANNLSSDVESNVVTNRDE